MYRSIQSGNTATWTSPATLAETVAVTKAMGDEGRLRVLALLTSGELCLCQIIEILGLAPSTVSKHMSILRNARLIEQRKQGRWHFYRLAEDNAADTFRHASLAWLKDSLCDDPTIRTDAVRLRELHQCSPEEWTKCYRATQADGNSSTNEGVRT